MWNNHLYISFLSPIVLALHFPTSVFLSKVSVCVCLVPQWCLNFCDPMDSSLPSSSVHGIFQARILEWVAISYSRGSSYYIPKHIYRNTHTHTHTHTFRCSFLLAPAFTFFVFHAFGPFADVYRNRRISELHSLNIHSVLTNAIKNSLSWVINCSSFCHHVVT